MQFLGPRVQIFHLFRSTIICFQDITLHFFSDRQKCYNFIYPCCFIYVKFDSDHIKTGLAAFWNLQPQQRFGISSPGPVLKKVTKFLILSRSPKHL